MEMLRVTVDGARLPDANKKETASRPRPCKAWGNWQWDVWGRTSLIFLADMADDAMARGGNEVGDFDDFGVFGNLLMNLDDCVLK